MSTTPQSEHRTTRPWHCPLVQMDTNRRSIVAADEPARMQADWIIETRPQRHCVFRVLATARCGDEIVEAKGQWDEDALDKLQTLLKRRSDRSHLTSIPRAV